MEDSRLINKNKNFLIFFGGVWKIDYFLWVFAWLPEKIREKMGLEIEE
jgi:hypothetical protein